MLLGQALLDELLQADVQGRDQLGTGIAVAPGKLADDAAQRVDLDLAGARRATQLGIVDLFQPGLADTKSRQLQQRIVAHFVFRRRPDIA